MIICYTIAMNLDKEKQLLHDLSFLEHRQWMLWAQTVLETEKISNETRIRWKSYMVPYDQLPEDVQKKDRVFAQETVNLLKKYNLL